MLIPKKIYNIAENLCDRCEIIALNFIFIPYQKEYRYSKKPVLKISKFCAISHKNGISKPLPNGNFLMIRLVP